MRPFKLTNPAARRQGAVSRAGLVVLLTLILGSVSVLTKLKGCAKPGAGGAAAPGGAPAPGGAAGTTSGGAVVIGTPAPFVYNEKTLDFFGAVQSGDEKKATTMLEADAALINKTNMSGETSLHQATVVGAEKMLTLLLDKGAEVNVADKEGKTPLDAAIYWHNPKAQELLKARGAVRGTPPPVSPEMKELSAAIEKGDANVVTALLDKDMKELFRSKKLRKTLLSEPGENGNTALHLAVIANKPALVSLFIDRGALRSAKNRDGDTALDLARQSNRVEAIKMLR